MTRSYYSEYDDLVPKVDLGQEIHCILSKTGIIDENWEQRVDAIKNLTVLMHQFEPSLFCSKIGKLKDNFLIQLKDLRSSVIKELCQVFQDLSEYLQENFQNLADYLIPGLIKILGSSKVMIGYADTCIECFITNSCSYRSLQLFLENVKNRNPSTRKCNFSYVYTFCKCPRNQPILEKKKGTILQVLKLGLEDSILPIRNASMEFYWQIYPLFPSQLTKLASTLQSRKQRTLEAAKPRDLNVNSVSNDSTKDTTNLSKKVVSSSKTIPIQEKKIQDVVDNENTHVNLNDNKSSKSKVTTIPVTKKEGTFHYRLSKSKTDKVVSTVSDRKTSTSTSSNSSSKPKLLLGQLPQRVKRGNQVTDTPIETPKRKDVSGPVSIFSSEIGLPVPKIQSESEEIVNSSNSAAIKTPIISPIPRRLSAPYSPPILESSPPSSISDSFAMFSPVPIPPSASPKTPNNPKKSRNSLVSPQIHVPIFSPIRSSPIKFKEDLENIEEEPFEVEITERKSAEELRIENLLEDLHVFGVDYTTTAHMLISPSSGISQDLEHYTTAQINKFNESLTFFSNLPVNTWNRFINDKYSKFFNFLLPVLEFKDKSVRSNRMKCYHIHELQLLALNLFIKLWNSCSTTICSVERAIEIVFSIHASTKHPEIRQNCENLFSTFNNESDEILSNAVISLIEKRLQLPQEDNENNEYLSDIFLFLSQLLSKKQNNGWILNVCSSNIMKRCLKISSLKLRYAAYKCITLLLSDVSEEICTNVLKHFTKYHQSLFAYRKENVCVQ